MIILEVQTTYDLYFAEDKRNDAINSCIFWKEDYILSTLKNIISAYPFSEMMMKKLGIFDFVNELYGRGLSKLNIALLDFFGPFESFSQLRFWSITF